MNGYAGEDLNFMSAVLATGHAAALSRSKTAGYIVWLSEDTPQIRQTIESALRDAGYSGPITFNPAASEEKQ